MIFSLNHFIAASISLIFYSFLNIAFSLKLKPPGHLSYKDSRDHIGQHISLVHSILACIFSFMVYLTDLGIDYESDFSYKYILVMGHTMGYFTYDMVYAEIFGVHDLAMRFHHICVMIGGYMLYFQDKGGSIGILCIALTELSNPPMQLRLILKGHKKESSMLYVISETSFAVIFCFNRGFIGTLLTYNVYQYDINYVVRLFVSLIYGVSLYWVYVIFCMLIKNFKKQEKRTFLVEGLVRVVDIMRKNQYLVVVGIFTWSIFMPIALKNLGEGPQHLRIGRFTII